MYEVMDCLFVLFSHLMSPFQTSVLDVRILYICEYMRYAGVCIYSNTFKELSHFALACDHLFVIIRRVAYKDIEFNEDDWDSQIKRQVIRAFMRSCHSCIYAIMPCVHLCDHVMCAFMRSCHLCIASIMPFRRFTAPLLLLADIFVIGYSVPNVFLNQNRNPLCR